MCWRRWRSCTKHRRAPTCISTFLSQLQWKCTYDEHRRNRRLERVRNLVGILAHTPFTCPYGPESLAQTLLSSVSCRLAVRCAPCVSSILIFARLPTVVGMCVSVRLVVVTWAGGSRREACGFLLVCGQQIGLERWELERGIGIGSHGGRAVGVWFYRWSFKPWKLRGCDGDAMEVGAAVISLEAQQRRTRTVSGARCLAPSLTSRRGLKGCKGRVVSVAPLLLVVADDSRCPQRARQGSVTGALLNARLRVPRLQLQ